MMKLPTWHPAASALVALTVAAHGATPPPPVTPPPTAADAGSARTTLDESLATLRTAQAKRMTLEHRGAEVQQVLEAFQAAGVNVRADWAALDRIGIDRDDTVDLALRDVSVYDALVAFAQQLGEERDRPVVDAGPGQLILTTDYALAALRLPAIYDVADIITDPTLFTPPDGVAATPSAVADATSDAERATALVALILDHVDPDGWIDLGGNRGKINHEAGRLIVSATPATHTRLARFLAQMRREVPINAALDVRVVALPSAAAATLVKDAAGDDAKLAALVENATSATTLWHPVVVTRLGEPTTMETSDAGSSLKARFEPRRDRIAGVLSIGLRLEFVLGESRFTFDGMVGLEATDDPARTGIEHVPVALTLSTVGSQAGTPAPQTLVVVVGGTLNPKRANGPQH